MLNFFHLPPQNRLETAARLLDEAFEIPGLGYKVGIDPIFSVIPVAGSFLGLAFSLYFFWEAWQLKVPWHVYIRMIVNMAIDTTLGAIPVVGIVADALWKSNKKNAALLLRYVLKNKTTGNFVSHGQLP